MIDNMEDLLDKLGKNGMNATFVPTAGQAKAKVLEIIPRKVN